MEALQSKLSVSAMTAYIGIFKEPRGLVRLLQFIFAIFAFATACNGSSSEILTAVATGSASSTTITASWSYPYSLQDTQIQGAVGNNSGNTISDSNDVKPSAQFFVFTGVTSMLLSLAFAVLYVVMDRQYRNDERFPIIDFIITLIWAIFWIAASSAWAQGVSNIRSQTNSQNIADRSGACTTGVTCTEIYTGTFANIIVSVIFGFLNFFLWLSSAWFVYKETKFFKSRTAQQQQQTQPPQQQEQQPNNFSNIGSTSIQQQAQYPSQTQQPPQWQYPPPGNMG